MRIFTKRSPLLFSIQENELKWLFFKETICLEWIETKRYLFDLKIVDLTTLSLKKTLVKIEKNQIIAEDIDLKKLEKIVKTNYKLVTEYLIILVKRPEIKKFYEIFSNLNLSDYIICVQSMEFVKEIKLDHQSVNEDDKFTKGFLPRFVGELYSKFYYKFRIFS